MRIYKKYGLMTIMILGLLSLCFLCTAQETCAATYRWETTVSKSAKTKTVTRKKKMEKKSKVTRTTTGKPVTKTSKKQTVNTSAKKQTVTTAVTTTVRTSLQKGSKIQKIVTITKTIRTTVTQKRVTVKKPVVVDKTVSISQAAPKAHSNILKAFETLGFKIRIDSFLNYTGKFDSKKQEILLKKQGDTHVYHELGHFLAFITNASGLKFETVYQKEKGKYTLLNKVYVTQSRDEFFAEGYYLYVTNPVLLKKMCPETYQTIQKAVALVTDNKVQQVYGIYKSVWK